MANVNSYYLYQKYEKRGDQPWIPLDVYSIDGDGTMPIVMKEEDDPSCPEPQYRTITTGTTCNNANKYTLNEFQISYDEGGSWYTVSSSTGTLIAEDVYDCGYRTRTTTGETYCENANQYKDVYSEVSRNYGFTWTTASTSTILVAENVYSCGYRTDTTSGTPYCSGETMYDKYVDVYYRESRDYGETWITASTVPTLVEANSQYCGYSPIPASGSYLTFIALEDDASWYWYRIESNNPVYYSTDGGTTWGAISGTRTPTPTINKGEKIMFKGINVKAALWSVKGYNSPKYKVRGNIMSIVAGDDFMNAVSGGSFASMFNLAFGLVDAGDLIIPTETAPLCHGMFTNCTLLTRAPKLPATTLINSCYHAMFNGCSSLTKAPELPATTLADHCYYGMFEGCTSITTAPSLPATTLAESCYDCMFKGCTALVNIPSSLPASTLDWACYSSMFEGCTSITTAPSLPATTLAQFCYSTMFKGCTALVNVPFSLPVSTLCEYCYSGMFNGCTSLTTAPEILAGLQTGAVNYCMAWMFKGCSSLNYIKCMLPMDMTTRTHMVEGWVEGVAASGTFVRSSNSTWSTGDDGIPYGWTVN